MQALILLDALNIVRCMATEIENLHQSKIDAGMTTHAVEMEGTVGDEYDPSSKVWTVHPENYAQPTEDEVNERKIQVKINATARADAITALKTSSDLPADFTDTKG